MRRLVALDAGMGQGFIDALRRAWDRGDAVVAVDLRLPAPALKRTLSRVGVGQPVADGDALVVLTSGTTAEPRPVVLTHDALQSMAEASAKALDIDPVFDRWLTCLPLSHMAALNIVVQAVLTDTPVTVHPRFDADEVAAAARAGATLVALPPRLLRHVDSDHFRRILVGGTVPPPGLPGNVVSAYGLTETAGAVVHDGLPLGGTKVRAVEGEIWIQGPTLLRIYRDGTDPKHRGGWLATGDRGQVDPATGRLTVLGRSGDLIVTDGEAVWPEPVEAMLVDHPDVADAAIVGAVDRERGQRVVAIVVPRNPASPPSLGDISTWVEERVTPEAAPREVRLADALPRTPLGKLQRRCLRLQGLRMAAAS